jgi:hypothetical protein
VLAASVVEEVVWMSEEEQTKIVTDYWRRHYAERHCTLCGNRGVIDSRGVCTPAGVRAGRLNYCICPNGQALRAGGASLSFLAEQS